MSKMKAGWFKTAKNIDGNLRIERVKGKRISDGLFAYSDFDGVHLVHEGSLLRIQLFPDWRSCIELSEPIKNLEWSRICKPSSADEFMNADATKLVPKDIFDAVLSWKKQVQHLLTLTRSLSVEDFN